MKHNVIDSAASQVSAIASFPASEEEFEEMAAILEGDDEETEAAYISRIQSTPLTSREKLENLVDLFEVFGIDGEFDSRDQSAKLFRQNLEMEILASEVSEAKIEEIAQFFNLDVSDVLVDSRAFDWK